MGKFAVTNTLVKPTDTLEKFEKKVKKAQIDESLDPKKITQFLDELDKKEGAWGCEACIEVRELLEQCMCEGGEES